MVLVGASVKFLYTNAGEASILQFLLHESGAAALRGGGAPSSLQPPLAAALSRISPPPFCCCCCLFCNDSSRVWFTYTSRPKLFLRGGIVYIHVSSRRVPAESKMWEKNDALTSLHNRLSCYRSWETTKKEVVPADLFNEPDCRDLFIKIKKKKVLMLLALSHTNFSSPLLLHNCVPHRCFAVKPTVD